MHKTLSLVLVVALLLPQSSTSSDKCHRDHTLFAKGATAQEQAHYIDDMLGIWVEWGSLPTYEALVDMWLLYQHWQGGLPLKKAVLEMTGLSPKESTRVMQELDQQMDQTFQNMAAAWHCYGVVNAHRQDTEWEGGEGWPVLLREGCRRNGMTTRLGRAYALAQAHAGPSRMHCHKHAGFLIEYMRHSSNVAYGMTALQETTVAHELPEGRRMSEVMLVKLLAQALEPRLRGAAYNNVLQHLGAFCWFAMWGCLWLLHTYVGGPTC